jgi:hypothetical protein
MNSRHRAIAALVAFGAAAVLAGSAGPVSAIPAADYVIDCIADDPDGSSVDGRDERTIDITDDQTVTVFASGCDWYYAADEIAPSGAGVYLGGASQLFTVTGAASLNIYVAGLHGFVWQFQTPPPPTTTTVIETTTTVPDTTTTVADTTTTVASSAPSGSTQDAVVAGGDLTVSGENWASRSEVKVVLRSDPVVLGTVTTGRDGTFTETFALPDGIAAGAHEVHLTGRGADGNRATVVLDITIGAVPVATTLAAVTTAAASAPTLPATGDDASERAVVALLVLIGGALLVSIARRPVREI